MHVHREQADTVLMTQFMSLMQCELTQGCVRVEKGECMICMICVTVDASLTAIFKIDLNVHSSTHPCNAPAHTEEYSTKDTYALECMHSRGRAEMHI